jgi:hypothetical protein
MRSTVRVELPELLLLFGRLLQLHTHPQLSQTRISSQTVRDDACIEEPPVDDPIIGELQLFAGTQVHDLEPVRHTDRDLLRRQQVLTGMIHT